MYTSSHSAQIDTTRTLPQRIGTAPTLYSLVHDLAETVGATHVGGVCDVGAATRTLRAATGIAWCVFVGGMAGVDCGYWDGVGKKQFAWADAQREKWRMHNRRKIERCILSRT